jgi:hypothetical protein
MHSVMVAGVVLVQDGEVLVADEAAVRAEAQVQAEGVVQRGWNPRRGRRPGAQGYGTAECDVGGTAAESVRRVSARGRNVVY